MEVRWQVLLVLCLSLSAAALSGCSGPPTLYPIAGNVTLGGKAYPRLIVYFREIDAKPTIYNVGVGETDSSGVLTLRSSAGDGLPAGNYRVTFSCIVTDKGEAIGISDEKTDDDRMLKTVDLVPAAYADDETSPVEFEVTSGENLFQFDIPPG